MSSLEANGRDIPMKFTARMKAALKTNSSLLGFAYLALPQFDEPKETASPYSAPTLVKGN